MSGTIVTSNFAKDLLPLVTKFFGLGYTDKPTFYDKLFDVQDSERHFEERTLATAFGLPAVVNEASPIPYQSTQQGATKQYIHVKYGTGFKISQEAVDDDQVGVIAELKAKGLKRSMIQARDIVASNVFNNAFSTALSADGAAICSAHTTSSGTLTNYASNDFSEAALETALIDIQNFTDDAGLRIVAAPDKISFPLALQFNIARVLDNDATRPATADRDIPAMSKMGMLDMEKICNPFYTSNTTWFLHMSEDDVPMGAEFFNRWDIELFEDSDIDVQVARYASTMRFSCGVTDFRAVFGCNGP